MRHPDYDQVWNSWKPVLELWCRGDLTYAQIAAKREMTRGQVAGIIWRARKAIADPRFASAAV